MAQYKVIQDIEAEDKLVGPFSLRQFVYAGIAAVCIYLSVVSVSKGAAFLLVVLVPPALFCMFFAWPWSPDQPTEVWALAKIRFFLKPRRRIWDQSGVKELVTITAPKKVEHSYTNGLSQTEVESRLSALADTIDSRGWVIKNSLVNLSAGQYGVAADTSDRLVNYASLPQQVSDIDVQASDDMLDEQNSPIAQQFDQMIATSTKTHRDQLVERMRNPVPNTAEPAQPQTQQQQQQPPANLWFLNQPAQQQKPADSSDNVVFADPAVIQAGTTPRPTMTTDEEAALSEKLKSQHQAPRQMSYSHLKNVHPLTDEEIAQLNAPSTTDTKPTPSSPSPAILNLASNNDLNVATLAREAHKASEPKQPPDDEVVISLH